MLVSETQMNNGATKAYKDVLLKAKKDGKLNTNTENVTRIRYIAKRLIPHTIVFRKNAPNWKWEVNLIDSKQLNAWCMPGGKIVFYSGIIEKLNLTDAQIAAIMGHEIAHALREHSRERASTDMAKGVVLNILQMTTGTSDQTIKLANLAVHYTVSLPFSRRHESEADKIGVELAARAGYNPEAAR